ncbi:hypothetical protein CHS0354_026787 [Potamilus streckersoni]|uniref:Uncharacterized protein n=1 Tax=Potamilus streckersoni TaxID=2493646 RepID=A0AAE0W755_9BIVA|nr:hypothetical protein CHS0354_026787 [Potamilus streckersoni]
MIPSGFLNKTVFTFMLSAAFIFPAGCSYYMIPERISVERNIEHTDMSGITDLYIESFTGRDSVRLLPIFLSEINKRGVHRLLDRLPAERSKSVGIVRVSVEEVIFTENEIRSRAPEAMTQDLLNKEGDTLTIDLEDVPIAVRVNSSVSVKFSVRRYTDSILLYENVIGRSFQQVYRNVLEIGERPDADFETDRLSRLIFSAFADKIDSVTTTRSIAFEKGIAYNLDYRDTLAIEGNAIMVKGLRYAEVRNWNLAILTWMVVAYEPDKADTAENYLKNRASAFFNIGQVYMYNQEWENAARMFAEANLSYPRLHYAQFWSDMIIMQKLSLRRKAEAAALAVTVKGEPEPVPPSETNVNKLNLTARPLPPDISDSKFSYTLKAEQQAEFLQNLDRQKVIAPGRARLFNNNKSAAEEQAMANARRAAVEQKIGVLIDSRTITENWRVIQDNVYSSAQGFISGYTVLKSEATPEGDYWEVTIEAEVADDKVESKLNALRILQNKTDNRRYAILYKQETNRSYPAERDAVIIALNTIKKIMARQGFRFFEVEDNPDFKKVLRELKKKDIDYLMMFDVTPNYPVSSGQYGLKPVAVSLILKTYLVESQEIIAVEDASVRVITNAAQDAPAWLQALNESSRNSAEQASARMTDVITNYYGNIDYSGEIFTLIFTDYTPIQENNLIKILKELDGYTSLRELKRIPGLLSLEYKSKLKKDHMQTFLRDQAEKSGINLTVISASGSRLVFKGTPGGE